MERTDQLSKKAEKVIASCRTMKHLLIASRYVDLTVNQMPQDVAWYHRNRLETALRAQRTRVRN